MFHRQLSRDSTKFNAMFDALKNPNPSRGTGITHAKFLCLMSALRNENAAKRQRDILIGNNKKAFDDVYYNAIARSANVLYT